MFLATLAASGNSPTASACALDLCATAPLVAAASSCLLILPLRSGSFSDGMPLGIVRTLSKLHVGVPSRAQHLMHPSTCWVCWCLRRLPVLGHAPGFTLTSSLVREDEPKAEPELRLQVRPRGRDHTHRGRPTATFARRLICPGYASFNNSRQPALPARHLAGCGQFAGSRPAFEHDGFTSTVSTQSVDPRWARPR